MNKTLAPSLTPPGFARPGVGAIAKELRLLGETAHTAGRAVSGRYERFRTPYAARAPQRSAEPVLLVPGFGAGDTTLTVLHRTLRQAGFRTYRSQIRSNVRCTLDAAAELERRVEAISAKRGSRVQIVGHSLGGMLARGLGSRRPDLISGVVTLGSPMLAPGAHHLALSVGVEMLVRLSDAGVQGLMTEECVRGACAQESFAQSKDPLSGAVALTSVYSKNDGIVDWRACIDPEGVAIEVKASHCGMAVDPCVSDIVTQSLQRHLEHSVLEIDRSVIA